MSDETEKAPVEIETPRLVLTMLPSSAAERQLAYFYENREHLAPWSPPQPPGFYSVDFWQWRLSENRTEYLEDRSLRLQAVEQSARDGAVIAQLSFTVFSRGPHQSANLGYSIDRRFEGRGLMKEALRAAIGFAFGPMGFHRIAANYMPTNERSGRLLRNLGFVVEGYARDYLFLNGAWRDHVLTALYSQDSSPPGVRAVAAPPEH